MYAKILISGLLKMISKSQFHKIYLLTGLLIIFYTSVYGEIKLPRLVSNGMVLQRNEHVRVWGWGSPGEKVTIRFAGKTYSTITRADSEWSVMFSPMKAGGPYSMEIDGNNHIVLKNILIGDVWLCSGQSNMELPMYRVQTRYESEMEHAENNDIRQFLVPNRYDFKKPQTKLSDGSWVSVNPWTIPEFSATAYFFARNLYKKYHVPIGLINASVGGTPICAWMSEEALKKFPKLLEKADEYKNDRLINKIQKEHSQVRNVWEKSVWNRDKGLHGKINWYQTNYNDSDWSNIKLPGFWSGDRQKNKNGVVWFRKEFNVPTDLTGIPARLYLGAIVDADYTYINGVFVGSTSYKYPPRIYNIASGLLKPGKNVVTIRVINYSGRGGFVKDKPYKIVAGGQTISLKGIWKYKFGVEADKPLAKFPAVQNQPSGLFNGMINPLLNYTIKGAIWYQGESNTGNPGLPDHYFDEFTSMIKDWRNKWGEGNFPFLFVQLPNYLKQDSDPNAPSNWAKVRNAQLKTLSLPNTGMAVTIDIGEWNDVHPSDKNDVGKRLSLVAQKVAYGNKHIIASGPVYKSMKIEGNKAILTFKNIGGGLIVKGNERLRNFAIAGNDNKFIWANAVIKNNKVVVWSDKIAHPVSVRYAWADNPGFVNFYNKEGLPASPFNTDN